MVLTNCCFYLYISFSLIQRDDILEKRIIQYFDQFTTKDIGDIGENLVHGHECMRIKLGGREDLLHLLHYSLTVVILPHHLQYMLKYQ